jgi:hypothetical protein
MGRGVSFGLLVWLHLLALWIYALQAATSRLLLHAGRFGALVANAVQRSEAFVLPAICLKHALLHCLKHFMQEGLPMSSALCWICCLIV